MHGDVTQIGYVHGDVNIGRSPARRWRRVAGGAVGALVVAVAATIGWRALDRPERSGAPEPEPALSLTTKITEPCGYRTVRDGGDQPGHVDGAVVALVAQNTSTAEVVVVGIRVELKGTPTPGARASRVPGSPCAPGEVPVREFTIDFDTTAPRLTPRPKPVRPGEDAATSRFPYRLSRGDPEVFEIGLVTEDCDCRFALVVDWVANGEQKSTAAGDLRVVPR